MLWVALSGALLSAQGAPLDVDREVRTILSDERFEFCHNKDYPLAPHEAGWCPIIIAEGTARCPTFPATCDAPRAVLSGPQGKLSKRVQGESNARPREVPEPEPEPEPESESLGLFVQLLFWGILLAAVVLIGMAIASNLARGRGRDSADEPEPEPSDDGEQANQANQAAARAMETDVDRLLRLATAAAATNDYAAAVDYSHAALLRRLDHEQLIRLHHSRTNGDYVRELRGNSNFFQPVRDALRLVDRAQFSDEAPTVTAFGRIFEQISTIVKRVGPLVVLLGLAVGAPVACDYGGGTGGDIYPWGVSPSGNRVIIELVRARGGTAGFRSAELTNFEEETLYGELVIVLLKGVDVDTGEWKALSQWVNDGGRLIVAGGELPPWLENLSYARDSSAEGSRVVLPHIPPRGMPASWGVPLGYLKLPKDALLEGERNTSDILLERDGAPYALHMPMGSGQVVVLASEDLFTNAAMAVGDNAAFTNALLQQMGRRVEFVDALLTAGADGPLEGLQKTHLTPAVVQLLAFLLALFAWRGARFGLGRDPKPPSRRAFSQHARALGLQYTRARASTHAAAAYAAWVLERLRDRFPLAAGGGLHGLAQVAARRSGRDETDVMRLLVEAHTAIEDSVSSKASDEDLTLIRELGKLLRSIGSSV